MRRKCLSTACFSTRQSFKHTHFRSLLFVTTVINTTNTGFHQFCSERRFSSFISSTGEAATVQTLHSQVLKKGSLQKLNTGNYILSLYIKSRDLENAYKMFGELPARDVRSWTIVLSGSAQLGYPQMVMSLLKNMHTDGVFPNQFTLSSALKCCSSLNELKMGKEIHGWILRNGIALDVVLSNSILDAYVKCGAICYAERLFQTMLVRDIVSWNIMVSASLATGNVKNSLYLFRTVPDKDVATWNTMIDGLLRNGFERKALELLYEMVEVGFLFNEVTFTTALAVVSSLLILELGRQIHGQIITTGLHDNRYVRSSLIDMYSKCGDLEKATMVFQIMPRSSVRTISPKRPYGNTMPEEFLWSSMVSGYVRNFKYEDALKTFGTMVYEQIRMDKFTLTSVVSVCATAGILELGCQIHAYIQKIGQKIDVHLGSALIDMYTKSGSLEDAQLIFKEVDHRNVVLWTSMISGFALHGQPWEAIQLFESMIDEGVLPNEVTFLGLLTACTYAGLLKEGCEYFRLMKEVYGIKPGVEHFTSMVDLYGRAGCFDETKEFIYKNGISHLSPIWRSFLSSCRVHKNYDLGKWVSEKLLKLEPNDPGHYVLLSNMCATDNKWEEAARLRFLMQQKGVEKHPGQSWIQVKNQVHTFVMGDRSHPQQREIYSHLDKLIGRLKEIGYSPEAKLVMQDVEEEQGEELLSFHSEKLAVVYGIMSKVPGVPIRIMKNLRICVDCHNFIKYTSKLLDREIIVRDIHRFHHFKHGQCSCGDYW